MIKLKELREENGYTQQKLADLLNRKKATICDWEKDRCQPSIEDLNKLANLFNCTIDYIIGREDDYGIIQTNSTLNTTEEQIITLYRKLNERDQHKVLGFIQALTY